jgi:4'-phosphopantetheinyl transferase
MQPEWEKERSDIMLATGFQLNHFQKVSNASPATLTPDQRCVDVWLIALSDLEIAAQAVRFLSPDEYMRSRRFIFERDRISYTIAHAATRRILSGYTKVPALNIHFRIEPGGKPTLDPSTSPQFNLSHAHEFGLLAVSPHTAVGVDIERIGKIPDMAAVGQQFLSRVERRKLYELPPHLRDRALLMSWTRKEAYVKAIGEGLSFPLDRCVVTLDPGEPARFLTLDGSQSEASEWSLFDIAVPNHVGALAIRGRAFNIRGWLFDVSSFTSEDG